MDRRIAVRGIFVHDGKLLCAKLKPYKTAITRDYWCVPGGTLEPSEALVAGLEREIIEETGVAPKVGNLIYIQQFAHDGKEHMEFFFYVTNPQDYMNIDLSKTSHGATEIAELAFIDVSKHTVLPEFLATEPLTKASLMQLPKIFNYL